MAQTAANKTDRPRLNAAWHARNRMPARATLDRRVAWHLAHAEACGCRPMPGTILLELERRGIRVPQAR